MELFLAHKSSIFLNHFITFTAMKEWELEFEWLRIRHYVKGTMGTDSLPDIKAILFLIGIQELGQVKKKFNKEEKQDLMHVAICSLLEDEGYYEFIGRDDDGWPHWEKQKHLDIKGVDNQEVLLKKKIILYLDSEVKQKIT